MTELPGLRERKKLATYRALASAAQELALERGLDAVTAEDIAQAAGVSVRTFFNYFSCKEEAIVGLEPEVLIELADQLRGRPADEPPLAALRAVLVPPGEELSGMLQRWSRRNELVQRYPSLQARHLAAIARLEECLAEALAGRLGVDATVDPTPRVVVATALAALRASLAWWLASDKRTSLVATLEQALRLLPATLPADASAR